MGVVLALVDGDEHLHLLLGVVVEGIARRVALLVVFPPFLLNLLLGTVVDDGLVDGLGGIVGVFLAFEDVVELVVVATLLDAAEVVVFQAHAALHLTLGIFHIDLDEGVVFVVDIVGATDDAVLVVDHMLEGCQSEAVVFIAGAEDNILSHGEVSLAAALTFGVVFGHQMLHLVAALQVVVVVVASLVHHCVDALHRSAEFVVLQVVTALCRDCGS